jgi:hypothetical protein
LKYSFCGGIEHKLVKDWEQLKFKMNLTMKDGVYYELPVQNTHTSGSRTYETSITNQKLVSSIETHMQV